MARARSFRAAVALVAAMGLSTCTDATTIDILEIDASGVLFGFVFLDTNQNSVLDGLDTPLPDISVVLTSGRGTVIAESGTDTLGLFRINDIPVGSYQLILDPATVGDSLELADVGGQAVTIERGDTTRVDIGASFPFLTVEEVLTAPEGKRVFTSGIALNARIPFGDGRVHIQGAQGFVRALNVIRSAVNAGDSVRLQGRTAIDAGRTVLTDVTPVVLVAQAQIPVPVETTTGEAARADNGALDAGFVRVREADILDTMTVDGDFLFTIDDGSGPLGVTFQSFLQVNTSAIQPDSIFRVDQLTGLLVPSVDFSGQTSWRLFPRAGPELILGVRTVDLSVTVAADDPVGRPGDTVILSVILANSGGLAASGVEEVDSLPAGLALLSASATRGSYSSATGTWSLGTVPQNASDTLRLTTRVTTGALGALTNTARLRPLVSEADVNPANNVGFVVITVVPQIDADVEVEVSSNRTSVTSGDTVEITILTINNGPFRATNVRIADTLPSGLVFLQAIPSRGSYDPGTGLWTLDTVHAGSSERLQVKARASVAADTTVINRVFILPLANEVDSFATNDTASVSILLRAPQLSPAPTTENDRREMALLATDQKLAGGVNSATGATPGRRQASARMRSYARARMLRPRSPKTTRRSAPGLRRSGA